MGRAIHPEDMVGTYATYTAGQRVYRGSVLRVSPDPGCVEILDAEMGTMTVPSGGLAFEDEDRLGLYANALARVVREVFGADEDEAQDFVEGLLPGDLTEFFDSGLGTENASLLAAVDELLSYGLSGGLGFREE